MCIDRHVFASASVSWLPSSAEEQHTPTSKIQRAEVVSMWRLLTVKTTSRDAERASVFTFTATITITHNSTCNLSSVAVDMMTVTT